MDLDTQVKLTIYNHFAATGKAPPPGDVAASIDAKDESVLQAAHNRWQRKRAFQGMQTLHLLLFCSMIA
jgi:hypothetical protein